MGIKLSHEPAREELCTRQTPGVEADDNLTPARIDASAGGRRHHGRQKGQG